jgi:hypothetical protein
MPAVWAYSRCSRSTCGTGIFQRKITARLRQHIALSGRAPNDPHGTFEAEAAQNERQLHDGLLFPHLIEVNRGFLDDCGFPMFRVVLSLAIPGMDLPRQYFKSSDHMTFVMGGCSKSHRLENNQEGTVDRVKATLTLQGDPNPDREAVLCCTNERQSSLVARFLWIRIGIGQFRASLCEF